MFILKEKDWGTWGYMDAVTHGTTEIGKTNWVICVDRKIVATGTADECIRFLALVKKYRNVRTAEKKMYGSEYCPKEYMQQGQESFGEGLNISLSH